MTIPYEVTIIGAGPAGMASAIQLARYGCKCCLIEKDTLGGSARCAWKVENYPGLEKPLTGIALMERFQKDVSNYNIPIINNTVSNVYTDENYFHIQAESTTIISKKLIVACGLIPRDHHYSWIKKLPQNLILSYIPACDIPSYIHSIAIIGGGDAAVDQGISFSSYGIQSTICFRKENLTANTCLIQEAYKLNLDMRNLHIIEDANYNAPYIDILFTNGKQLSTHALNFCTGKKQYFDFLPPSFIQQPPNGLYFAGDCIHTHDRHIAIACGDGISAAMHCISTKE